MSESFFNEVAKSFSKFFRVLFTEYLRAATLSLVS